MSVANGQPVNASVTNAAFVSKTTDSTVVSKVTLNKSGSGTTITDTQAVINKALDAVGTTEADATPNNYSSANFVTNGDNRKVAIGKLDTQLKTTNDNVNAAIASNTSQDTRLTNLESNNMTIAGNKTFSGNTVFSGDVTVNGTTTTINSTTQDVVDPNITVNKGGTNLTSEGAGITVDRAGTKGSIIYKNASATKFAIGNLASEVNIVDESTAQTLSNKNFPYSDYLEQGSDPSAPAATYRRIYSKADGFYQRDSAGVISKVGTGSGSGGAINLVTNGDADSAIATIFVPYQDSSGTRPIDGTGGTTTGITTALTATAPLSGTNSFTLTKDAANRQGGGWSAPFTVDLAYRAKSLKISVDYIVNSGTFVAGSSSAESDVIFYLYDVTNSQLIEPSNIKLFASSTSTSDKYEATFQTSATGSSYRLIAHIQSVSALAYELKVDNVTVAPSQYVYAAPVTATITGGFTSNITTNVTLNSMWRTSGDRVLADVKLFFTGANTQTGTSIYLPVNIDRSKLAYSSSRAKIGSWQIRNPSSGSITTGAVYTSNGVGLNEAYLEAFALNTNIPFTIVSDTELAITLDYPGLGLSATTQQSDGYDARELSLKVSKSTGQSIPYNTWTKLTSWDITNFTNGLSWDATNHRVVAVSAGTYSGSASLVYGAAGGTGPVLIAIYKNGTSVYESRYDVVSGVNGNPTVSFKEKLNANDYLEVFTYQATTTTAALSTSAGQQVATFFTVSKDQAPTTISATETLVARYTSAAGQTPSVGVDTIIDFGTKVHDTHNAVTTGASWKFTSPSSSFYSVNVLVVSGNIAWSTATQVVYGGIFKNGNWYANSTIEASKAAATNRMSVSMNTLVQLNAGEYIDFRYYQSQAGALFASDKHVYIEIVKIK